MKTTIILEEGVTTIDLYPMEHALFLRLAQEPDRFVTFDDLWWSVWGYVPCRRSNAQAIAASQLRRKLAAVGIEAVFCRNGIGYSLRRKYTRAYAPWACETPLIAA